MPGVTVVRRKSDLLTFTTGTGTYTVIFLLLCSATDALNLGILPQSPTLNSEPAAPIGPICGDLATTTIVRNHDGQLGAARASNVAIMTVSFC